MLTFVWREGTIWMTGKTVVLIALFAAAVVSYPATSSLLQDISLKVLLMREEVGLFWLIVIALAYAILLAIPFVPGIELGLIIMVLFGASGAIVAHVATVLGLLMAFAVGSRMAERSTTNDTLGRFMAWTQTKAVMGKPASLLRLNSLLGALKRHRHLALAVLLNLPGNAMIGGGGGIAFMSGASREFRWPAFALTSALATAPVPLLVIAGKVDLVSFLARGSVWPKAPEHRR